MKRTILLIAVVLALFITTNVYGQWTYKTVSNDIDEPYKIAYSASNNGAVLKLESTDTQCDVFFYISGGYHCDDSPIVNISFLINGVYEKYVIRGTTSSNSKTVFFGELSSINVIDKTFFEIIPTDFTQLFKSATAIKLRINESHCDNDYYEFNMSNSSNAYHFMTAECSGKTGEKTNTTNVNDNFMTAECSGKTGEKTNTTNVNDIIESYTRTYCDSIKIDSMKKEISCIQKFDVYTTELFNLPNCPYSHECIRSIDKLNTGDDVLIKNYIIIPEYANNTFIEVSTQNGKSGWIQLFFFKDINTINKIILQTK